MLVYVLAAVGFLVALVLVLGALRPKVFRVERKTTIRAPAARIHALIEDFHAWPSWSPYEKLDPAMRRTLSGPDRGRGAVYEWDGSSKAGAGRMEITDSTVPTEVVIRLAFTRPFKASNVVRFTLAPRGDSTEVVWAMEGACAYPMRVMGLFMDMDAMIGKDFVAGLGSMKSVAEA